MSCARVLQLSVCVTGYVICHVRGHIITLLLQLLSVIMQPSDVTEQAEVFTFKHLLTRQAYSMS